MMPVSVQQFTHDFAANWGDTMDTSMRNYTDQIVVNMRKMAPFATGRLIRSISNTKRIGRGKMQYEVISTVPYAIRRNYENNLHPQTKHYIERSIELTKAGGHTKWWKSLPSS